MFCLYVRVLFVFCCSLHRDKNRYLKDIMVQVLLKQGQVEVSTTGLTADYTDSVLSNRSEVENLNRTIRVSLQHQTHILLFLKQGEAICAVRMDTQTHKGSQLRI